MFIALLFIAALAVFLVLLLRTQARGGRRLPYKTLASACFLGCGLYSAWRAQLPWGMAGFLAAALLLSLSGDVLLALPDKFFIPGLVSFLLAQVGYTAYFLAVSPFAVRDAALFGAIALPSLIVLNSPLLSLGAMRVPVNVYALVISLMAAKAVSVLFVRTDAFALLCAAGAVLFMASDYVLAFEKFGTRAHKRLFIPNLITYYAAVSCLALSALTVKL